MSYLSDLLKNVLFERHAKKCLIWAAREKVRTCMVRFVRRLCGGWQWQVGVRPEQRTTIVHFPRDLLSYASLGRARAQTIIRNCCKVKGQGRGWPLLIMAQRKSLRVAAARSQGRSCACRGQPCINCPTHTSGRTWITTRPAFGIHWDWVISDNTGDKMNGETILHARDSRA